MTDNTAGFNSLRPLGGHPFAVAALLPLLAAKGTHVHRNIEILIGRLITDEAFRQAFIRNPATAVAQFVASGYHVTELEAAALTSIDHAVWSRVADEIDPRLRKWSLVQD